MAPPNTLSAFAVAALTLRSVCAAPAPEPKVIAFNFEKKSVLSDHLGKRASSDTATLYNVVTNGLYLINATFGTPPQAVSLQLDTGSSDVWVPWSEANICKSSSNLCSTGTFDPSQSSTFSAGQPGSFTIDYVDGTHISGEYFNDTFGIAGVSVSGLTMGLAQSQTGAPGGNSAPFQGLIGVGFDENESIATANNFTVEYPNIISQLVLQNKINTRAYSLWLNDLDASTGSILFGGVDTSKYTGDLVVLPLQDNALYGLVNEFGVVFAGVTLKGDDGETVYSANTSVYAVLDSGTTLTYLPPDIAIDIIDGVGVANDSTYGLIVPCSLAETQGVFDFQLGNLDGPIISVPISEFVLPFSFSTPTFQDGETACKWGLQPGDDPTAYLLGDTFLRSAYVVYNIEGKSVAIGQTVFNSTDSNVKEITASNSIPGATSTATGTVASGAAIVATSTGTGTFALGSVTGTASSTSSAKASAASLHAPSTPFVSTIVMGITVLFGMLGGSMFIFL